MKSSYHPHERVQKTFKKPSVAVQAQAKECDINNIMRKFDKTGVIEHVGNHGPSYEDAPSYDDLHEAMNLVTHAQSMFAELPARIRAKFANDPAEFLEFVDDPDNRSEMALMGLIAPEPAPEGPSTTNGDPQDPTPEPTPEAAP